MARERDFRQRVVSTANLLLEAASMLEESREEGAPGNRASSSRQIVQDNRTPSTSRRPVVAQMSQPSLSSLPTAPGIRASSSRQIVHDNRTPSTSRRPAAAPMSQPSLSSLPTAASPSMELRGLFNWNPTSGGKRKSKSRASGSGPSKRVKVRTWTHTWVCLSRILDDEVPDASERAKLKLAGLGERRFAIDANATAQELTFELEFQFPKLKDSGGFELMRTMESGSREIQVIEMPGGGYSCEYLKAVVHSAKLFIRPLQADLSMELCEPEVSL